MFLAISNSKPAAEGRSRPVRIGILHGLGLWQLKITAADLTVSGAETYPDAVKWAQAAHDAE
jgi:hypothetical protein